MARPTAMDMTYQSAHIGDDRRRDVVVSHAICITLAVIAVVLRFVSRRIGKVKVGWDDYVLLAAFAFAFGQVVAGLLGMCLPAWCFVGLRGKAGAVWESVR